MKWQTQVISKDALFFHIIHEEGHRLYLTAGNIHKNKKATINVAPYMTCLI